MSASRKFSGLWYFNGHISLLKFYIVGLAEAVQLANSLLKFPQMCMNTDRESAYYAAYRATSLEDALKHEYDNGIKVIQEESIPGT